MIDQINSVSFPAVKGKGTLEGVLMKRALDIPSMKVKMPKLSMGIKLPRVANRAANQWKP